MICSLCWGHGRDGWLLHSFLFCLFWTAVALLFSSATLTPCLTAWCQAGWSFARFSQVSMSMPHGLRSLLLVSLYRRRGRPAFLLPPTSSPYKMSLGVQPGSMRLTWPSQRRQTYCSCCLFHAPPCLALSLPSERGECTAGISCGGCLVSSPALRRWSMSHCHREEY